MGGTSEGLGPEQVCRSARELISLALDGEISRREALRLRTHLLACSDCSAHRRQLGGVAAALRASAPALAQGAAGSATVPGVRRRAERVVLVGAAALALVGVAALAGAQSGLTPLGALSAAQGMPVYGGLRPDQGFPVYVYEQIVLPRLR